MYSVKILKDSVSPCNKRLTTWELIYPRMVHAELMTHRQLSKNSASSRAIPNEKLRQRVQDDPAFPVWWGKNQAGMQAREELTGEALNAVKTAWIDARDQMLVASENLSKLGLHKQLCNRLIEPWMFITVIMSATELDNWFHLRDHPDAQPEIAWVAKEMHRLYSEAEPERLEAGEWHLPLIYEEDRQAIYNHPELSVSKSPGEITSLLRAISVGRCARVSYLTHEGKRDIMKDIELHDKLSKGPDTGQPGHWSPFEHVAQALEIPTQSGNFIGWFQYRKMFMHECYVNRR